MGYILFFLGLLIILTVIYFLGVGIFSIGKFPINNWAYIVSLITLSVGILISVLSSQEDRFRDFVGKLLKSVLIAGLILFVLHGTNVTVQTYLNNRDANYITLAGRVIAQPNDEWANNRLVLLFQNNQEVARAITGANGFPEAHQGVTDGVFVLHAENTYQINRGILKNDGINDFNVKFQWADNSYPINVPQLGWELYRWFGDIHEGDLIRIGLPSKRISYALKIIEGDIVNLPSEIQTVGSTELRDDGRIIVWVPVLSQSDSDQSASVQVNNIIYNIRVDETEVNRLTVPIDNCKGSAEFTQTYSKSQTFIHQYTGDSGFTVGAEIPFFIWAKILPQVQAKYGFEQGQIDEQQITFDMTVAPQTSVVYYIVWRDVWEVGSADISYNNENSVIPFRVKTSLTSEVTSAAKACP